MSSPAASVAGPERSPRGRPAWLPRIQRVAAESQPGIAETVASYAMILLAVVVLGLVLNLTVVSRLEHFTAQHRLYDQLRLSLAQGSVPIGQTDNQGHLVVPGTPIALLQIPEIGVKEVVVEGTTSEQTREGVGHRRDTPYPGQPGVSVLLGRKAAYGGVFGHLDQLRAGQTFTVTTGEGVSTYRVIGPRIGTTQLPELSSDQGRLTLVTASGPSYMPTGVLRVDAQLVSKPFATPPVAFASGMIAPDEQALAGDGNGAFALSWLLELLVVLAVGLVWAWKRWDSRAAWIVLTPAIAAVAFACADRVCDLLPNLL